MTPPPRRQKLSPHLDRLSVTFWKLKVEAYGRAVWAAPLVVFVAVLGGLLAAGLIPAFWILLKP